MKIVKYIINQIWKKGWKILKVCIMIIFCICLIISWPLCFLIQKTRKQKGDDYR